MEDYLSTKSHPASLDLRGHFHLEPGLSVPDPTWPPEYPMDAFPITDEQAILVRAQRTSLIDIASEETHWTITCPALEAALDSERSRLALGAKGQICLWDLRSGSLLQILPLPLRDDIPTALAFHPQGEFLASTVSLPGEGAKTLEDTRNAPTPIERGRCRRAVLSL